MIPVQWNIVARILISEVGGTSRLLISPWEEAGPNVTRLKRDRESIEVASHLSSFPFISFSLSRLAFS